MNIFNFTRIKKSFLILNLFLMPLVAMTVSSCDLAKNHLKSEREANLEFQDYRDAMATRIPDVSEDKASGGTIPELQPYIAQAGNSMKSMPLVTITINQTVPLRDALYELAQQADYDIELDPRIKGSIIFSARNRPFDQVIERISNIAGLRYNFNDDMVRVELDEAYNKVYKIDYLSYIRKSKSGISNNVSVVNGDGADSGSQFEASSESEMNFWGELETNLEQIVKGSQTGALKTKKSPRIVATDQNPQVQALSPDGTPVTDAPEAVLNVENLPVEEEEEDDAAMNNNGVDDGPETFTINRQAGLISVFASEKSHKEVANYLILLKRAVSSQVLIEAKVLEVTLNDEFATGIDWSIMGLFGGEATLDFLSEGTVRPLTNIVNPVAGGISGTTVASNRSFVAGFAGNDVQALVEAISGFGTVKALASPRLTVLNNQPAVLNVATNRVFFDIDVDVTRDDNGTTTEIDSEILNVPEGVLINVQPSINMDDRTVAMAIRPTITRVVKSIPDPAITYITAANNIQGVESLVPELNVQEIDSVIQVRSGQPIVMGGLLQDRVTTSETGVPVLSETPVFGNLFKDRRDSIQKTELVIFLEATILESPSDSIHNTDKDLYRQFSSDRRPLRF